MREDTAVRALASYIAGIGAVAALTVQSGRAEVAPANALQPAFWAQHDEIDYLDNLPRKYSCDELYYKYRDVLLRLGARPGMKIYTYGCTGSKGAESDRVHVDLTYEIPQLAPPTVSAGSTLMARPETVAIGPGDPKALTQSDCVLLKDMRQTVLSSISQKIEATNAPCGGQHPGSNRFALRIQTAIAAKTG
jgi:hypothetical protein